MTIKAREIMKKRVVSVTPNQTVGEVARLLDERRISGAPVVDQHGKLMGVVSRTDLVRHEREEPRTEDAGEPWYDRAERLERVKGWTVRSPDYTRVSDLMTPSVVSADEGASVQELAKTMVRRRIHRVVITSRGRMTGIVSSLDLVRALLPRTSRPRRRR
jgi:CBS domain-containing protein